MAKKISDFLQGAFSGGGAGAGALGGLGQAGMIGATAMNPWAWGLIGGGALLGGVSSMFSEDDVSDAEKKQMELSNQLLGEKMKDSNEARRMRRQVEARRSGFSMHLNNMFAGANLAGTPMASERLA